MGTPDMASVKEGGGSHSGLHRRRCRMAIKTSVLTEGIAAGFLGATGVALWFLGVDLAAGHPLQTPSVLGGVLLRVLGGADNLGPLAGAALYTPFHFAAFLVIGIVASALVDGAQR